jgi:hypothetical protein
MQEQVRAALLELLGNNNALGFCDPPKPIVIYANRSHADAIWYTWDFDNNTHVPIQKRAITCVVTGINVVEKEYKNKTEKKFQVRVQADRAFTIESGLDTQFAKGLIASLDALGSDISKSIVIEAEAGETETVLFCRVYLDGESVRTQKYEDIDFVNSLGRISLALGGTVLPPASATEVPSAATPKAKPAVGKPVAKAVEPAVVEDDEAYVADIEYEYSIEDDAQIELVKHRSQREFSEAIALMTVNSSATLGAELAAATGDNGLGICHGQVQSNFETQLKRLKAAIERVKADATASGIPLKSVAAALGAKGDDCTLAVLVGYADSIEPAKVLDEIAF